MDIQEDVNWCFSGGARGADTEWGIAAKAAGHKVCHFSFVGHKAHTAPLKVLTHGELIIADRYLQIANQTLKRPSLEERSEGVLNLLRRNYYQQRNSGRLYAIGTLSPKGIVKGGTSWAVQMFIDRHDQESCQAYLFDQEVRWWMKWGSHGWEQISPQEVPVPLGIYAGIGTRELNRHGSEAIRSVYVYQ